MMGDHVFGVDRGVPHGGVQLLVTADLGRDMRGQARPYRIGHEDSAEVVGSPLERFAGDGELRGLRGRNEAFADVAAGQRAVLGAVPPLEQERHGRAPGLLEDVVGADQRQGRSAAANPEDDRGQDLGEFRGNQQQSLGVGL